MAESVKTIREFLVSLDRALTTRRLYSAGSAPYHEASKNVLEKFQQAAGEVGFALRIGPKDLSVGKVSVLSSENQEDWPFFTLFRDGLRELSFSSQVTVEELDQLLSALEAERNGVLGPSQDTVSFLWRCDLHGITFTAIDGIGDQEGEGQQDLETEDYRALVADLMSKIQDPAAPSTGQGYAFMLDADSRVAASDLHYQATTIRRSFEENPTVLSLTPEEVARLRDEAREENEEELLERFIRILFVILTDCTGSVSTLKLGPVLEQLLEAYWKAEDYRAVCSLLARLQAAAQEAPVPENRELARNAAREFLTEERIRLTFQLVEAGALSLEEALPIWAFIGHETWDLVVDFWWALPEGELRIGVKAFLHKLVSSNPELLRKTLTDEGGGRMRAGLALVNDPLERLYEKELLALAGHPDPSIRLKGVAAAGRIGGPAALETLWKSMESDPAKPVRLLAFRLIAQSDVPQLPSRLRAVVTAPDFASRPLWEREKYVRLLGAVGGESARSLFESWLPQKRWLWQRKDHEAAKLAVVGLGACGAGGLAKVQALAKEGGKLAEIAQKALSSLVVQPGAEAHR